MLGSWVRAPSRSLFRITEPLFQRLFLFQPPSATKVPQNHPFPDFLSLRQPVPFSVLRSSARQAHRNAAVHARLSHCPTSTDSFLAPITFPCRPQVQRTPAFSVHLSYDTTSQSYPYTLLAPISTQAPSSMPPFSPHHPIHIKSRTSSRLPSPRPSSHILITPISPHILSEPATFTHLAITQQLTPNRPVQITPHPKRPSPPEAPLSPIPNSSLRLQHFV